MGATAGAGAAAGLLGGLVSNQKEGAKDTGNVFNNTKGADEESNQSILNALNPNTAGLDSNLTSTATGQLQNSGVLGGIFGQGGTLDQTVAQEQQQANQPWQLTAQDQTQYGQAAGNIANQFGQSNQSLAQSLSDRGLSSSGAAGAAFTGAQGNQNEQLAGLQTQIANNRQQLNMQQLAQTQNFLGQLGQQATNNIQGNVNNIATGQNLQDKQAQLGMGFLKGQQTQDNTQLEQQQGTAHGSTLSNALGGMAAGSSAGYAAGSASQSGMSGGGQKQVQGQSAGGGDMSSASMFA